MEQEMMDAEMMREEEMLGGGMNSGMPRRSTAAAPAPAVFDRPMLAQQVDEVMVTNVGLIADMVAQEFDGRYRAGKFGSALVDVMPKKPSKTTRAAPRALPQGDDAPEPNETVHPTSSMSAMVDSVPELIPMWKPGLVFLGEVGSDEALESAKRQGLDFLFQFDVVIKESKSRSRNSNSYATSAASVENTTRVRLYHVGSGKTLGTTKAIENVECSQLVSRRQYPDNEGYVEDQCKGLWIAVDRYAASKPLPELTADSARRRVGQLLGDRNGDVLRMLAEVRLYESRGWLTPQEVEAAFDMLAGSKGLSLLYAPEEEQRELIREMIIKSLQAKSADG